MVTNPTQVSYSDGSKRTDLLCHLFFKRCGQIQIRSIEMANAIRLLDYLLTGAFYPLLAQRKPESGRLAGRSLSEADATLLRERTAWAQFLSSPHLLGTLLSYYSSGTAPIGLISYVRKYVGADRDMHLYTDAVMTAAFEQMKIGTLLDQRFLKTQNYASASLKMLTTLANMVEANLKVLRDMSLADLRTYNSMYNRVTRHRLRPQSAWLTMYDRVLAEQMGILITSVRVQSETPSQKLAAAHTVLSMMVDTLLGREMAGLISQLTFAAADGASDDLYAHTLYFMLQMISIESVGTDIRPTFDPGFSCVLCSERPLASRVLESLLQETGNVNAYQPLRRSVRQCLQLAIAYRQTLMDANVPDAPGTSISSDIVDERWVYRAYSDYGTVTSLTQLDREMQWMVWAQRAGQHVREHCMTTSSHSPAQRLTDFLSGLAQIAERRLPIRKLDEPFMDMLGQLYDCRITATPPSESLYQRAHLLLQGVEAPLCDDGKVLLREFFKLLEFGLPDDFEVSSYLSTPGISTISTDSPPPVRIEPDDTDPARQQSHVILDHWERSRRDDRPNMLRIEAAFLLSSIDGSLLDDLLGLDAEMVAADSSLTSDVEFGRHLISFASTETFESERMDLDDFNVDPERGRVTVGMGRRPVVSFVRPGVHMSMRVILNSHIDNPNHSSLVTLHAVENRSAIFICDNATFLSQIQNLKSAEISEVWLTQSNDRAPRLH